MVDVLRDLDTILNEDLSKDFPLKELELVLWVDTVRCKSVIQHIKINQLYNLEYSTIKNILTKINSACPIAAIIINDYKVYRVTKTEDFMNKSCDSK